jgi:putative ABC transport system permease protein
MGILRAVGVTRRRIWIELLSESVLLGTAGVAVGLPLGIALGRILLPVIARTTALNYKLVAPDPELSISAGAFAIATCLGLAAAVLAAALPAWRASHVDVSQTIRAKGIEGVERRSIGTLFRVAVGILAVSAVLVHVLTKSVAWGLFTTGLIAVGIALSARPLVGWFGAPLARLFRNLGGATAHFGTMVMLRNPRRTALSVAVLGLGVGFALWLRILAGSFENSVIAALSQAMRADLIVNSANIGFGFVEAPVDESLLEEIRRINGVAAVAGELARDWQYEGGPIALTAFDPIYFGTPAFGEWPLFGRRLENVWNEVANGRAVVVSSNFAQNLNVDVGSTLVIETPQGALTRSIAGITRSFLSPRGTMVLSRDVYREFWGDDQITHAFVLKQPGVDVAALRGAIEGRLGRRYRLRVLSAMQLMDFFRAQVRRAFAPSYIVIGLVLLVVMLGMADTLAAGVMDRTQEIGMLRAVGVSQQSVRRMVMIEALVMGVFGLILGVTGGYVLGILWVKATFTYLLGWVLEAHIPYGQLVGVCIAALIVCMAASLAPARRAARFEPAVALRYE